MVLCGYCMVLIDTKCGSVSFALDAVIIGASSIKHLEENIKSTKHGPLHEGELNYSNHFQLRSCTHLSVVLWSVFRRKVVSSFPSKRESVSKIHCNEVSSKFLPNILYLIQSTVYSTLHLVRHGCLSLFLVMNNLKQ